MAHNPVQGFVDECKELIVVGFLVVVVIMIFGLLASIPGAPAEARAVAESGQEAVNNLWILYLGIPSTALIGLIIWFFAWARKQSQEFNQGTWTY